MIRFALFGAGRIGKMHADIISNNPNARLDYIYDLVHQYAENLAEQYNVKVADPETILADDSVDAVLIASSTDTHVDLIVQSALAGKAILCEKPIDLDINRVDECARLIADVNPIIQLGFNRRYDPSHNALIRSVHNQEVGKLEAVIITSRDPEPPPLEYVQVSGGIFRDMMIHDFDLARCILGEEPNEITAIGSVQVNADFEKLDDVDSAMVMMKSPSGKLCHINCSRRAVYGYDQRVEAFGAKGMLISNNPVVARVERYNAIDCSVQGPLHYFFVERYSEAYKLQLDAFIDAIVNKREPTPSFNDGRQALILANAAKESLQTSKTITLYNT